MNNKDRNSIQAYARTMMPETRWDPPVSPVQLAEAKQKAVEVYERELRAHGPMSSVLFKNGKLTASGATRSMHEVLYPSYPANLRNALRRVLRKMED